METNPSLDFGAEAILQAPLNIVQPTGQLLGLPGRSVPGNSTGIREGFIFLGDL